MDHPIGLPPGRGRRLLPGQYLFHAGDRSLGLVRVVEGRVELRRPDANGRFTLLHGAGPGETLAEAALFQPHHHCDAVATLPAEVTLHSLASLRRAAMADPSLPWRLVAHLSSALVDARSRAARLAMPGAEARLLDALAQLPAGPTGLRRPPTDWKAFASELGLAHETLYRALARLARAGRLERANGAVRLPPSTLPAPRTDATQAA